MNDFPLYGLVMICIIGLPIAIMQIFAGWDRPGALEQYLLFMREQDREKRKHLINQLNQLKGSQEDQNDQR